MARDWTRMATVLTAIGLVGSMAACGDAQYPFDPQDPARGPGELVGYNSPLNDPATFIGGGDIMPAAASVLAPTGELPDCDADCRAHCASLNLENPVNRGMCENLWGVGLATNPVNTTEACRRLWIDTVGRFPTRSEVESQCESKSWGEVVTYLINHEDFVLVNQRRWADRFLYNTTAVSLERIFDMDELVGKVYRGLVPYDQFAAVASAHPVLTRRFTTPSDKAEALFNMFLGRPPYENERSDLARLYQVWGQGYYDHPVLQMRLPDAIIDFPCIGEDGKKDPDTAGECTSVLWGYNQVILEPDMRARVDDNGNYTMWSGLIRPEEWALLQKPGRIVAETLNFWENLADEVIDQYLGYDLGRFIPAVRSELVEHVLANGGDVRAVHHAVLTSFAYLQSAQGGDPSTYRWTYGPLKQVDVEPWIDTIKLRTGYDLGTCDHRISDPGNMMGEDSLAALALVQSSRWLFNDEGEIRSDYRNLAQTLGGCPNNEIGGRFKTISILTTATQEGFVMAVCNPTMQPGMGTSVSRLLPDGVSATTALTEDIGADIVAHQAELFLGRTASALELSEARDNTNLCAPKPCTAEQFARPVCYALLSSAEMLFY